MRYFLGVDVGGWKTLDMITDESGHAIGFGSAGMGNYQIVGYNGFREVLHLSVTNALAQAGIKTEEISGAGFGIAGYDWPSQLKAHQEVIASLGLKCPVEIVNDAVIGLVAGTSEGWGIAVVGGTGCNCRGRDRNGREGRVTGEGGHFGEWGGGAELVGKALQTVSHEWSRRGPHTELSSMFLQLTGAKNLDQFIEGIDLGHYEPTAAWALAVFQAAYAGDTIAGEVVRWSGHELGELACAVIRQLEFENEAVEVVEIGGLFDGGPLYVEAVQETILKVAPRAMFVRLNVPPVVSGVLLGAHLAALRPETIRSRLIETTEAILKRAVQS